MFALTRRKKTVMNSWPSTLAATALMLALAGCAEKLPSQWGFRYEDRDRVVEAADKLEALATNLYNISRRPLDYSASPAAAGLNAIRFFAAESARFHRAARAWQPGSQDIGFAYNTLTDRWGSLRTDTGALQAHEQARAYLQRINELMQDLGALASNSLPAASRREPAPVGKFVPAEPKPVEPPAATMPQSQPQPASAPAAPPAPTMPPPREPSPPPAPRVQPAPETSPAPAPPAPPAPREPAPQPPAPAPPEEKPPLLPPLSPIAPNPGVR
jgi:hypothetical protein